MWSIGWEFHGFWDTIAQFLYHTLFLHVALSTPPPLRVRECVRAYFTPVSTFIRYFIVTHALTLRTMVCVAEPNVTDFYDFQLVFCSHWNNSLDRRCCHDVNTNPFGWLQSIKKILFFRIFEWRSAFSVFICAVSFVTWRTITWHFRLAFRLVGSSQTLIVFHATHNCLVEQHQSKCSIKCKSCYLLVWG